MLRSKCPYTALVGMNAVVRAVIEIVDVLVVPKVVDVGVVLVLVVGDVDVTAVVVGRRRCC